jgi:D-glycero-D-manno-heptose 1,7-bisphosphate phosphatase
MRLILLDRDGVVVVNRPTNIKKPSELELIQGSAGAIARLNRAGYAVAICTNQPEVGRGVMTGNELQTVHEGLRQMLAERGAAVDAILCCTNSWKCPGQKPAGGMLRQALTQFGARGAETAFVGDQADDLKAAFHAGCRPVLVLTGLGRKTLRSGLPQYVGSVTVAADLREAVETELSMSGKQAHQIR